MHKLLLLSISVLLSACGQGGSFTGSFAVSNDTTSASKDAGAKASSINTSDGTAESIPIDPAASLEIMVDPAEFNVNDAMVTVDEDSEVTQAASYTKPDAFDSIEIVAVMMPNHGSISFDQETLSYTYKPVKDFNGADSFTFQLKSGSIVSNTATISIAISAVNDLTIAEDITLETIESTPVSGQIIASDPDDDVLQFSMKTQPAQGTIESFDAEAGSFTYIPFQGYHGADSFEVEVFDGVSSSVVKVTVAIEDIAEIVEDLCKTREHIQVVTDLNFAPRAECNFGQNENLTALNGYLRARETQSAPLDLPPNAVICNFSVDSASTDWRYDDWVMFTLNDRVLVSSNEEVKNTLDTDNGIYIWDWDKAKNLNVSNTAGGFNADPYCIEGTCEIPKHDKAGAVKIDLDPATMLELASQVYATSELQFNLISMGDNDNGDCEHTGLDFQVNYEYVLVQ